MRFRRGPSNISKKQAAGALTQLLYGCTAERLASFTAASLASSYRVPEAEAAAMLARARQGRML